METAAPRAWETRRADAQRQDIIACHLDLAQAIVDRDAVAAAAAIDRHFDSSIGPMLAT
jgi:DNA-binding GntR family transcriptional regulator